MSSLIFYTQPDQALIATDTEHLQKTRSDMPRCRLPARGGR